MQTQQVASTIPMVYTTGLNSEAEHFVHQTLVESTPSKKKTKRKKIDNKATCNKIIYGFESGNFETYRDVLRCIKRQILYYENGVLEVKPCKVIMSEYGVRNSNGKNVILSYPQSKIVLKMGYENKSLWLYKLEWIGKYGVKNFEYSFCNTNKTQTLTK